MKSHIFKVRSLGIPGSSVSFDIDVEIESGQKTKEYCAAEAIFRAVSTQKDSSVFLYNWYVSKQSHRDEIVAFQGFFTKDDDGYFINLEKLNGFPVGKFYFTDALLKDSDPTFYNISISPKYCL